MVCQELQETSIQREHFESDNLRERVDRNKHNKGEMVLLRESLNRRGLERGQTVTG